MNDKEGLVPLSKFIEIVVNDEELSDLEPEVIARVITSVAEILDAIPGQVILNRFGIRREEVNSAKKLPNESVH